MPNTPVPAAALGLPLPRPDLGDIMRAAHEAARAMPGRLFYADRLAVALRRAWARARADVMDTLRHAVAERVERLLAFLDATDGDPNLEDGGDLEPDVDREPSLGSFDRAVNQENWSRVRGVNGFLDIEQCAPHGFRRARQALFVELAATRREKARIGEVIARLAGSGANRVDTYTVEGGRS